MLINFTKNLKHLLSLGYPEATKSNLLPGDDSRGTKQIARRALSNVLLQTPDAREREIVLSSTSAILAAFKVTRYIHGVFRSNGK